MDSVTTATTKQPRGLYVLFFTEMWERFSFYGMRALLILYMTSTLMFNDINAYKIIAGYMTLIYATPILGGLIGDYILGSKKAMYVGSIFIATGHFCLAFSGSSLVYFYIALAFIVVGTALMKTNISNMVGLLYKENDPRRDTGFTIFYVGINVGAFLAPIACGFIGHLYGWHYAFSLAGFGMLLGLVTLTRGIHKLDGIGDAPNKDKLKQPFKFGISNEKATYIGMLLAVPCLAMMLSRSHLFDSLLPGVGLLVVVSLIFLTFKYTGQERKSLGVIFILMFFNMLFLSLFEQSAHSLNLFTDRNVDREILGYVVPTAYFQSLNPLFIMILGPIFAMIWSKLSKKSKTIHPPIKFSIGLLLAGIGFYTLVIGCRSSDAQAMTSMFWLVLSYFLVTLGEITIMPCGLSMVTNLAPKKIVSSLLGVWFLSYSFAEYISGVIARFAAIETIDGQVVDMYQSLLKYEETFQICAYVGLGSAFIMLLLTPKLRTVFEKRDEAIAQ